MTFIQLSALLIAVLFSSITVAADGANMKLEQFVESVQTFSAHFEQTVIDADGNLLEQAEGEFQLQRPGKFRWDYHQPYMQQIVADGERIWFYDVDLEQVTVKSQQEVLADTPATMLSGEEMPTEKYHIQNLPSDDGLLWVELKPKQIDSSFQAVKLGFNGNTLQQMIMRDSFDQRTRLIFSQVKENLSFDRNIFRFSPPHGVDVVGDSE